MVVAGLSVMAQPNVVINEIMYNPPESGTDSLEFVELHNNGTTAVSLQGYTFSQGLTYTFGNVTLNAGDYIVVAVDSMAMQRVFGVAAYQWSSGGLSNGGEDIVLKDAANTTVDSVDYEDGGSWVDAPDGDGYSLELTDPASDNNDGQNWRPSGNHSGQTINGSVVFATPGAVNQPAVQLTFQVDMATQSPISATVSVAGNFQTEAGFPKDWQPGDTELFDFDNDSIYTRTVWLMPGTYEYKYVNGTATGQYEGVPGACAVNGNRGITLAGDTTLSVVCFGSCSPCPAQVTPQNIRFQVDMSQQTVSPNGVHIAGNFQGWLPGATPMIDAGNGIYYFDTVLNSSTNVEYKFINGNAWPAAEQVPAACAAQNGNRTYVVPAMDDTLPAVLFGTCAPKQTGPPVYDIATVTTVDANGDADSAGVLCELRGTVTMVNLSNHPRLEFYFQDATGGIGLFSFNNDFGYNPVNIGDSVIVRGTIGQFRGLTQIDPDTVILAGAGTLPTPQVVTTLDETTEGELIQINNVTLADPAQWPNPGSSGNVDIVVGNDTLTMRIDGNTEVDDSVSAPAGPFNLIGLGGQFDFNSPYLEGYQIFPRVKEDIQLQNTMAVDKIIDYTATASNGVPDSLGAQVVFEGLVTSVDFDGSGGYNFGYQDATDGIIGFNFSDLNVNGTPYQVTMGDELRIYGEIDEFRALTEVFIDSIVVLSQGNTLPAPAVVDSLGEYTEGNLIRINDAEVIDPSQWPSAGSSASVDILVAGDTLTLRIDGDTEVDDSVSAPSGTFDIIGIGSQFAFGPPYSGGYQIIPRMPSDIIAAPSTVGVPCADLYISEYFEGSGNNKGIEIYNPTSNPIDLSNYKVEMSGNGGNFTNDFIPDGMLAPGDVYVITTTQADSLTKLVADTLLVYPSVVHFNGDDAVYLLKGADTLDIIGEVGVDPGSNWPVGSGATSSNTLVRKSNVFNGTTNWTIGATQWDVYPNDFIDSLGSHTQDPCGSAITPDLALSPVTQNVFQFAGSTTVDVIIANPNNDTTEVEVYVKGGTATNGTDFTFTDTTVQFLPGTSTPITLHVGIIDQPGAQPNRTIVLGLRNANNNATISADTAVITIIDVPYYPIATISTEDADGVADSLNVICELRGVVTSPDFRGGNGLQFYMTDPTGSINVFSFDDVSGYAVAEGDSIHVIGTIAQFRGLTEIMPDTIIVVASGQSVPDPVTVTDLGEMNESDLVQITGISFIDTSNWTNSGSGFNIDITNGTDTFEVRIDNDSELFGTATPDPNKVYNIRGIVSQYSSSSPPFLDGYQLFPRYLTDLEEVLAPSADFTYTTSQLAVDFTDESTNAPTSWSWDFGDGNTSIDQNPQHTYAAEGTYEVCLTASNVAGSDTFCDSVSVILSGIDNQVAGANITLFPNPAKQQISLQSKVNMEEVTVMNAQGQVVDRMVVNDRQWLLPVGHLADGIYYLQIETDAGTAIKTFLKQ